MKVRSLVFDLMNWHQFGLNVEPSMPSLSSWAERLHSDRGNF